jgi:opacity protein-like surface antigen
MKRHPLGLTLAAAALLTASLPLVTSAEPAPGGVYINGQGGFAFTPGVAAEPNGTLSYKNSFNSYDFGGGIGYKSGPIRYEAQMNYIRAEQKSITGGRDVSGGTNIYAPMANIYFDFDMLNIDLIPFIGAGLGYAYVTANGFPGDGSSTFAYQGTIGASYMFDDSVSLDLAYRFFGTTTPEEQFRDAWYTNMVNLGVTYHFG